MIETVEYRDIPGFPGYKLGADRTVWSSHSGFPYEPGAAAWRPRRIVHRASRSTAIILSRKGKDHWRSIDKLMREVFPPLPAPPAFIGGPQARGSDNGRAKLSEADIIELRRLRSEDPRRWTYPALATRFGIGRVQVHYILAGKAWRHVLSSPARPATRGPSPASV